MSLTPTIISKCRIPINVQFEVSYRCNNSCIFCYNENNSKISTEADTLTAKSIIKKVYDSGVLTINFNGGEPLLREDFLELAEYAKKLGLDIHLNTNANLIDDFLAKNIAKYFPSICTTILSSENQIHDSLSNRHGALQDTINGILNLQKYSVYVAVNMMICKKNIDNINETLDLIRLKGIKTLLITRYVPVSSSLEELHISDNQFFDVIARIQQYHEKHQFFDRISLPQPIKLCNVPQQLLNVVAKWNIPCTIGLCTASISANGEMTPCNLVKAPVIGNLRYDDLIYIWNSFDGSDYCKKYHLKEKCLRCIYVDQCGGGCKGYNDVFAANIIERS